MAVAAGPGGPDSAWEHRGSVVALGTARSPPTARDLTGSGPGMMCRPAGTANGAPAGAPFPDTSGPGYQACTSSCRAGHRAAAPPWGAGRRSLCLPRHASRGWSRVGSRFAVSGRESVTPFYDGSAGKHSPQRDRFVISIGPAAHIAREGRHPDVSTDRLAAPDGAARAVPFSPARRPAGLVSPRGGRLTPGGGPPASRNRCSGSGAAGGPPPKRSSALWQLKQCEEFSPAPST
jgi:hypothetical protein